jgi:crotonobetainyl-CoA:carnitine CoA-transferase CaiB-like acyl-CoA transferase
LKARATGSGTRLEVASSDVAVAWMPDKIDAALNADQLSARTDGWTPDGRLTDWVRMEPFRTADGEAMLLGAHTDKFWQRFCAAIDRPDLLDIDVMTYDEGHQERSEELWRELAEVFAQRTKAEWIELFLAHDIAGGPVNTPAQLLDDPHFRARMNTYTSTLREGPEVTLAASPIRVPGQQFAPEPAPVVGEHTNQVLAALCRPDRGAR